LLPTFFAGTVGAVGLEESGLTGPAERLFFAGSELVSRNTFPISLGLGTGLTPQLVGGFRADGIACEFWEAGETVVGSSDERLFTLFANAWGTFTTLRPNGGFCLEAGGGGSCGG
jgi:hypothetical protein